jgi:hypothetical protein
MCLALCLAVETGKVRAELDKKLNI